MVDKTGSVNFARLIADATKDQPQDEPKPSEPLPRIIIDKLEVDRAGVDFTDERRAKPFSTKVDPVQVLLNDFSTLPDQEGKQTLVARTPEGEQLKWEGELGISPIQSRGTISLTGLSAPKIWRYGEELLNFEIASGTADLSTAYELDLKDPEPRLHLTDIRAQLKGWALKSRNKEDRVVQLDDVQVGPGTFDLGERQLVFDKFLVNGGGLGAQRGSDTLINWVELLKLKGAAAAEETAAEATGAKPVGDDAPWKIGIKEFRIADFGFTFSDDAAITPYDATVKRIALAFAAVINYAPTGSQVLLDQITLGLSDVTLQPRDEQAPIFTLASVELGTGSANYKDKSVQFDTLRITKPHGEAWIDRDGKLNWLGLAPKQPSTAAPADETKQGKAPAKGVEQPWRIGLKTIEVVDGGVTFTDRAMTPPVAVKVEPIRVKLEGASSDLKQAVGYELDVGVQPGGQFTSKGSLVPGTPAADGTLALRELPLKLGERYVNRFALLVLKSGSVSAAGKYAFAMRNGKPTAQFNGGFQVAKLDLVEEGTKERFLGWDMMDVRGIDFKFEPTRLDIVEIRLDRPGGKFIIYEDRTLNIQRILRTSGGKGGSEAGPPPAFEQAKAAGPATAGESSRQVGREDATSSVRFGAAPAQKPAAKAVAAPKAAPLPFPVNIQRIRVNKGELYFADLTLTPQFGTRIHDLSGTVNSLSTRPGSKAQMKLEGAVDEYGLARFSGDLTPFAPTDYMNVTATFRNVELTSMTPYSAKFAGYRIASGKLDADLEYFIQQRQLKGDNKIIVDQLTLGERVESPDAVNLPLELAIALLKDSDGKIDLGLPVSGSLDDPQFSIGGIVWKAFVNLLTKIVTSPFRALGALLGAESGELEGSLLRPGERRAAAAGEGKARAGGHRARRASAAQNRHPAGVCDAGCGRDPVVPGASRARQARGLQAEGGRRSWPARRNRREESGRDPVALHRAVRPGRAHQGERDGREGPGRRRQAHDGGEGADAGADRGDAPREARGGRTGERRGAEVPCAAPGGCGERGVRDTGQAADGAGRDRTGRKGGGHRQEDGGEQVHAGAAMSAASLARQATLVAALRNPKCFSHPVRQIEVIETHISWVILTGDYAYKIKKALDLGFLDFTTLPQREHFCREEVRLNRRLAPDLYLDVVPIKGEVDTPVIGGAGEPVEWAVRMREFERGAELSRLLPTGAVTPAIADEIADAVAAFHTDCARDTAVDGYGAANAVRGPVRNNLAALARRLVEPGMRAALERLRDWSEAEHRRLVPTFEARRVEGFVREGHGDLHLGNMALHGGRVLIFDCIEFNPRLRWVDVMSEIAFVVMDLTHRSRSDLARRLLNRYLERTGDYAGLAVLRYYLVYRALVRATVAAIRGAQTGLNTEGETAEIRAYLELAQQFTQTDSLHLIITHGVSGAGKTTVTGALLEAIDLIRIRSDVERKRCAGLSAESRSGSAVDAGLYTPEATQRSYERLRVLAESVLRAGHSVVLDATYLDRNERDACRALAHAVGARFRILACRAHATALRERVVTRERAAEDASEAGLEVLERQLDRATELGAEESQDAVVIDTSQRLDVRALVVALGLTPAQSPD